MAWEINSFDDLYLWAVTTFYALTGFHDVWYDKLSAHEKITFVKVYSELGDFTIRVANTSEGMLNEDLTAALEINPITMKMAREMQDLIDNHNLGSFEYFIQQFKTLSDGRKEANPIAEMMANIKGEA